MNAKKCKAIRRNLRERGVSPGGADHVIVGVKRPEIKGGGVAGVIKLKPGTGKERYRDVKRKLEGSSPRIKAAWLADSRKVPQ